MTVSPRVDLAGRLADAGGLDLSVFAEEPPNPPALPALVILPAQPYRVRSAGPLCRETWRLQILALVPIDVVAPLDELDVLIDVVRDVLEAMPQATYSGALEAPVQVSIGGKPMRAARCVVELTGP